MRKGEFFATLMIGIVLGLSLLFVLYLREKPDKPVLSGDNSAEVVALAGLQQLTPQTGSSILRITVTPPPQPPLEQAVQAGNDKDDILLLHNSDRPSGFSTNFCYLAQFYGLGCKKIDVKSINSLTAKQLLDEEGQPYVLIGLDGRLLDSRNITIGDRDLSLLMDMVQKGGTNLFLGKINTSTWPNSLQQITSRAISGVSQPQDSTKDWLFSSSLPDLTAQLTGLEVISNQSGLLDTYALTTMDSSIEVTSIISSLDDDGTEYSIFTRFRPYTNPEAGSIYIDSGESGQSIEKVPLWDIYNSASSFVQIVPLMMTIRLSYGDEIWHSNENYANLTIDEGVLVEPYQSLNYSALLEIMKNHNFHTTIAIVPAEWKTSDPNVVSLFLANPEYYSLVQYGNTGSGYEFYMDDTNSIKEEFPFLVPTTTVLDQELAIVEGMSRLKMLETSTGLVSDPIMIFPGGIGSETSFELLKQKGYLATVNVQDTPLGAIRPTDWDYAMYPVVNNFADFPNFTREMPGYSQYYQPSLFPSYLDLFIGKPVLYFSYSSNRSLFSGGMDAFTPIADQINEMEGDVTWQSLGYIARHLHSKKVNDDGSLSIKMFTPELILTNDYPVDKNMHIFSFYTGSIPIKKVTVNGYDFPYRLEDDHVLMDVVVPSGVEMRIKIEYDS